MEAHRKQRLLRGTFEALQQSIVAVEGKRDELALLKAGVRCTTIAVAGKKLEKTIEKIGAKALGKRVILLTDFDMEGRRLEKELRESLLSHGVKVDGQTRDNFRQLFGISTVEQLPFALERLEKKIANNSD